MDGAHAAPLAAPLTERWAEFGSLKRGGGSLHSPPSSGNSGIVGLGGVQERSPHPGSALWVRGAHGSAGPEELQQQQRGAPCYLPI